MKKLLFIYNTKAGKGRIRQSLSAMLDRFAHAGYLTTACPTQRKEDATALVTQLAEDFDLVVCSGGDGTLHEVTEGLMKLENPPPLGYIPTGTTNDFAKNLYLPNSLLAAAETAVQRTATPCDIGRFNGRTFVYIAAFGAFTDVPYDTPQELKNFLGQLAYVVEGATRITSLKQHHMVVEHDGGRLEGDFLFGMVSNTVSVAGMQGALTSEAVLDDGLFEVALVSLPKSATDFQSFLRALTRQGTNANGPLATFQTKTLTIQCSEPVSWTLDGEFGGVHRNVSVENCHHALSIVRGDKESWETDW